MGSGSIPVPSVAGGVIGNIFVFETEESWFDSRSANVFSNFVSSWLSWIKRDPPKVETAGSSPAADMVGV